MFSVLHAGDRIGGSHLEGGDPADRSVSGIFYNVGGAKALEGWMKSVGGTQDGEALFLVMNDEFALQTEEGEAISFTEGTLIVVAAEEETFVEFMDLPEAAYNEHFSDHLKALPEDAG
ncbi:MAG: hypothetical protein ACI87W_001431 [Halieaceae bacterium]|jgi:hypothetical protein